MSKLVKRAFFNFLVLGAMASVCIASGDIHVDGPPPYPGHGTGFPEEGDAVVGKVSNFVLIAPILKTVNDPKLPSEPERRRRETQ